MENGNLLTFLRMYPQMVRHKSIAEVAPARVHVAAFPLYTTDLWHKKENLNIPRFGACVVNSPFARTTPVYENENGEGILVMGGQKGSAFLSSVECYDMFTGKWTLMSSPNETVRRSCARQGERLFDFGFYCS